MLIFIEFESIVIDAKLLTLWSGIKSKTTVPCDIFSSSPTNVHDEQTLSLIGLVTQVSTCSADRGPRIFVKSSSRK
jgi:hypothetical protein